MRGRGLRQEVQKRNPAGIEAGEIDIQPVRQRCIDVGEAKIGVCRQEPGRCLVQIVDRVLQRAEGVFLLAPITGDVGDLPGLQNSARAADRAHGHPIPMSLIA